VTAAYAFALRTTIAGPVNLVAPNPVTNEQFTKALGQALSRPTIVPAPELGVRALYGEMGVEVLIRRPRVLPAKLLDAGFEFWYPMIDTALERALV
jgi:NAD dependent epimerase/dehydratase family enzyme